MKVFTDSKMVLVVLQLISMATCVVSFSIGRYNVAAKRGDTINVKCDNAGNVESQPTWYKVYYIQCFFRPQILHL